MKSNNGQSLYVKETMKKTSKNPYKRRVRSNRMINQSKGSLYIIVEVGN